MNIFNIYFLHNQKPYLTNIQMILYRPAVGIGVIGFHLELTIKVDLCCQENKYFTSIWMIKCSVQYRTTKTALQVSNTLVKLIEKNVIIATTKE
jgi:hypothetical protein